MLSGWRAASAPRKSERTESTLTETQATTIPRWRYTARWTSIGVIDMAQTNSETSFDAKEVIIKKTLESIFQEYDDRAGNRSGYLDDIETCWTDKAIKDAMYDTYLKARLAALDDCKTLLERVLSETPYHIGSSFDILWAKAINKALAELEALRKKVEG